MKPLSTLKNIRRYLGLIVLIPAFGCSLRASIEELNDSALTKTMAAPDITAYASNETYHYTNLSSVTLTPTYTGSDTTFSVSPALPTGLSIDSNTGVISGTPTQVVNAQNYDISASNAGGSDTFSVTLSIGPGFTVNSTAETVDANIGDGFCATGTSTCTIRAAIAEINASAVRGKVYIPDNTYNFSSEISWTGAGEMEGQSQTSTILNGQGLTRILAITASDASISNIKLIDGQSATEGGAINYSNAFGTFSVTNVTIHSSDTTTANYGGGALYFHGLSLTIDGSTFTSNSLTTFAGSSLGGGAVYVRSGVFTISNSTFNSNTAVFNGGALYTRSGSDGTIQNCTFSSNSTQSRGGAIGVLVGSLTIENSYFNNNNGDTGGGVIAFMTSTGSMAVLNSTFYSNTTAGQGGVLYSNYGNNSFDSLGEGWRVRFKNSTLVGNTAATGGAFYSTFTYIRLKNSLLYNNTGNTCVTLSGSYISEGNNLEGTNFCSLTQPTDLINTNPQLVGAAPTNNGGPTLTWALQITSPAKNAGDNAVCPTTDQRAEPRPSGGTCDIGAYEYQE